MELDAGVPVPNHLNPSHGLELDETSWLADRGDGLTKTEMESSDFRL